MLSEREIELILLLPSRSKRFLQRTAVFGFTRYYGFGKVMAVANDPIAETRTGLTSFEARRNENAGPLFTDAG